MWLVPLWRLFAQPLLSGTVSPLGLALRFATVHLGLMALATWSALSLAQTEPQTDPASPHAPPSVVAPPRPSPGAGQSPLLRERLVRQAFEQADRNGDGQLSREEAASIPGLPERFGKMDTNRDGQISREEFRASGGP